MPRATPVRRLVAAQDLRPGGPLRLSWDGRDEAGARAPDGIYHVRVGLRRQGRALTFARDIRLDTTPPRPRVDRLDGDPGTAGQQWIVGPVPAPVRVTIRNPSRRGPSHLRVLRTDGGPPRVVARFTAPRGATTATWDGRLADDGSQAPAGTYLVAVTVRDLAGNAGTSPPLPPQRGDVPGVPGLSVRRVLARPPADPVRAGEEATFAVDSPRRARSAGGSAARAPGACSRAGGGGPAAS